MQNSLFPQREFRINPRSCFVIMPIDPLLKNVYDTISTLVKDYAGMNCIRADEITKPGQITNDIWANINEARFLIADLTGRNPNVFYEVGIAHALNKSVILLTQNESDVPFDLKSIRYLKYDPLDLKTISTFLPQFLKNCISTIPDNWDPSYKPSNKDGSYIKLTYLNAPSSVYAGQPFEIVLQAKNNGKDAKEGYFSISFPLGIDELSIIESNANKKTGAKGGKWKNDDIVLNYPIAEAYTYHDEFITWPSQQTKYLRIQAKANHKGLLWFYVSSSTYVEERVLSDPIKLLSDVDQREEYVYCGVIEVI